MKKIYLVLACCVGFLCIQTFSLAQYSYRINQDVPVRQDGKLLPMPWSGGLNTAQVNTIDLDQDGKKDLLIFERSANKAMTFLNRGDSYIYAPEFEFYLPEKLDQWVLLRDINCDGKQDIFTSDQLGAIAFINITPPGGPLAWRPFNGGAPLTTQGTRGSINLKLNVSDIPAIDDIDGDGDLDILSVKFVGPSTVSWHKNMIVENEGKCDSLQFVRIDQPKAWGQFEDCECHRFAFDAACPPSPPGGRIQHVGGKAITTLDIDGDNDRDLLFSEGDCIGLSLLRNNGTVDHARIENFSLFPSQQRVNFHFPAAFIEDVNNDGLLDLICSPNIYEIGRNLYKESVWVYRNTGSAAVPSYTLATTSFLQHDMIDLGTHAAPAFVDYDGDRDQDMFIASFFSNNPNGNFSMLHLYENIGTLKEPSFKLIMDDFAHLSRGKFYAIRPQFIDFNNDGNIDLIFTAIESKEEESNPKLFIVFGKSKNQLDLIIPSSFKPIPLSLNFEEKVFAVDIDLDKKTDLLISRSSGEVQYWKNNGVGDEVTFSLENTAFMGLGTSVLRRSPAVYVMDMNADGKEELILGGRLGKLAIYDNFREASSPPNVVRNIIYDPSQQTYISKNMGSAISPVAVRLFNNDKPSIVVGTNMGGILILKNEEANVLPDEPAVTIYPNPVSAGDNLSIKIDRDALVHLVDLKGKQILDPFYLIAYQVYSINVKKLPKGVYILRILSNTEEYSHKVVVSP